MKKDLYLIINLGNEKEGIDFIKDILYRRIFD